MDVHSTAFLTQRNTFSHLFFKIGNVCLFILQNGLFLLKNVVFSKKWAHKKLIQTR